MYSKIRELREDNNLTQQQVAEYLGCDQSLYSKYERGEREFTINTLVKLAKFYHVSADYILGLSNHI